jgi:hypothetical protein
MQNILVKSKVLENFDDFADFSCAANYCDV